MAAVLTTVPPAHSVLFILELSIASALAFCVCSDTYWLLQAFSFESQPVAHMISTIPFVVLQRWTVCQWFELSLFDSLQICGDFALLLLSF